MAFRYRKGCKACELILKEDGEHKKSTLYKLIEENLLGARTITDIHRQYPKLRYPTLVNHSKKHQGVTENRLTKKRVSLAEKKIAKELQTQNISFSEAQQEMLDMGMNALRNGDMKMTANVIAKIAKDIADIELKKTDQAIELQKLFDTYIANPLPPKKEWIDESPPSTQ